MGDSNCADLTEGKNGECWSSGGDPGAKPPKVHTMIT